MVFSSANSKDCAAMVSSREGRYVAFLSSNVLRVICAAPLKKAAGVALTSPAAPSHNHCDVHDERVLAQPMMSECELGIRSAN